MYVLVCGKYVFIKIIFYNSLKKLYSSIFLELDLKNNKIYIYRYLKCKKTMEVIFGRRRGR